MCSAIDFGLYRIVPTGPADYTAVNPRPAAPEPVGGTLRVAAMNTLNFFLTLDTTTSDSWTGPCGGNQNLDCRGADADQPLEFTRQRDKLLAALAGLNGDIVGLNELENTPGVEPLPPTVVAGPERDARRRHLRPHRHGRDRHRCDPRRPDLQARAR